MKAVFRVDASSRMGIGHFMRCLTLAEALRQRGADIRFVCRAHGGHMIDLLTHVAIPVMVLPAPIKTADDAEDYAAWLGVTQQADAAETIEALKGDKPDWLIVDHYGLGALWEQALRPHVGKLLVIDDLANRPHDCDALLDQNYSTDAETRYQNLVPAGCRRLLGPRYALLRPEYEAYRKTLAPRDGQVRRILVFFGGSDPANVTGMAIDALSAREWRELQVDVVMGVNNPRRKAIEQQVAQRPLTTMFEPRPHLADLMVKADLAIGAGGATTWERMCLGLPSLVVSIAENQVPACKALSRAGLIHYVGDVTQVRVDHLRDSLEKLIGDHQRLIEKSTQSQLVVDGMGAQRIAEVLDSTPGECLWLRAAREDDMVIYFNWANDPDVCRQAIHTEPILWAQHQKWFAEKLADARSHLFVLQAGTVPVGQIRFDRNGDEARVDYSLDVLVRGCHWAGRLISMGVRMLHDSAPIHLHAEVKEANAASCAVFMRLGFEEQPTPQRDARFSICILSDRSSWLNEHLPDLILGWLEVGHRVLWAHTVNDLRAGDFCFYLSCGQIVPLKVLAQFRNNLVVHESDLPHGKGWSPLTWQILEGKNRIPVTLFEAAEKVDSGPVYAQEWLEFEGHELIDELRAAQARTTLNLCRQFVTGYPAVLDNARPHVGNASFYPRRKPSDSRLDTEQPIADQFALFRVVDNERYPAFFEHKGYKYTVAVQKARQH